MRAEWRWALLAVATLAIGAAGAEHYARFAAPYYARCATFLAEPYPWKVVNVRVEPHHGNIGSALLLTAEVRRHRADPSPAAVVLSRVSVGEVIETPLLFWMLLLAWPAKNARQRWYRLAVGIPAFLGLEVLTSVCQLLHPLAETSALLAGEPDPLTLWELWSRFLEGGGRFVVELTAAVLTVAAAAHLERAAAHSMPERDGRALLP